jgi:hypothetical protein
MANTDTRRRRQKGRTSGGFIILPHSILRSPEFGGLTAKAVKLLIELAGLYNGSNNGNLSCAYSVLKERGWRSAGTLAAAILELRTVGFLLTTRHGGKHRCSLYAITWWAIDDCKGKGLELPPENVPRNTWKNTNGSRLSDQSSRISDQLPQNEGEAWPD